jgi:hypothetical protein
MNIRQFLSNPVRKFKDGLALYSKVKSTKEYDDFFNKAGDPAPGTIAFNILDKQLARALRKQQNAEIETSNQQPATSNQKNLPAIEVKKILKTPAKPKTESPKTTAALIDLPGVKDVEKLPDNVKAAYFENKELFTQLAGARQRLAACKTAEQRQPIAAEIAAINKQKEQNWQTINQHLKPGPTTPEPEVKVTLDPAKEALKLNRRISTVKINISRAQKEINTGKLKGKKLETRLASLEKWENELIQLEGKLPK